MVETKEHKRLLLISPRMPSYRKRKLAFSILKDWVDTHDQVFTSTELVAAVVADFGCLETEEDDPSIHDTADNAKTLATVLYYAFRHYAPCWSYAKRSKESTQMGDGKEIFPWRIANPSTWALLED